MGKKWTIDNGQLTMNNWIIDNYRPLSVAETKETEI